MSRFHMTTSSAKTAPVSLAGCGDVKNKRNTDGMGKSASALQRQREEMTRRRRINHISRLTGGSHGEEMFLLLGSGLGGLRQRGCIQSKRVCVFARAPGGGTLGFDSLIVEFGRAGGKKVGPSHLTLTSPVNVRHRAAILEALLWRSWAHKSRAAMSFSALSPAVSGSKRPWDCFPSNR